MPLDHFFVANAILSQSAKLPAAMSDVRCGSHFRSCNCAHRARRTQYGTFAFREELLPNLKGHRLQTSLRALRNTQLYAHLWYSHHREHCAPDELDTVISHLTPTPTSAAELRLSKEGKGIHDINGVQHCRHKCKQQAGNMGAFREESDVQEPDQAIQHEPKKQCWYPMVPPNNIPNYSTCLKGNRQSDSALYQSGAETISFA